MLFCSVQEQFNSLNGTISNYNNDVSAWKILIKN